jgi:AraC-like DNA-binding protein
VRVLAGDSAPIRPRHGHGVGWIVGHLIANVEERGFDVGPIRRLPGLRGRDLTDPDALFAGAALEEAWQLAVAITRDDALGLHLAEQLPRGALDLVEYAFRASKTLAGSLDRMARYGRLINDRLAMRVLCGTGERRFLVGEPDGRPLDRQRAELSLALVLRLARETTASGLAPVEVSFVHPAPEDVSEHRRFFRSPLRFQSGVSEIVFSEADGSRSLGSADPALAGVVARRLEKLLARRGRPQGESLTGGVRHWLAGELGQGDISAAQAARSLGLSERTLSRRLAGEGTSFRAVLDRFRRETAVALLHDRALGVAEIAFFLGYSEPAAFHRSFKRWTGKTPLAYRRDLRAA